MARDSLFRVLGKRHFKVTWLFILVVNFRHSKYENTHAHKMRIKLIDSKIVTDIVDSVTFACGVNHQYLQYYNWALPRRVKNGAAAENPLHPTETWKETVVAPSNV